MTDMDRQLRETLKRIVEENGKSVLLENDGRRAVAFAADYLPRAKKERMLLKIVLDAGIAGKIHGDVVVRKQDPLLCRKKYVMRIREDLSIERGAAEFIVDCIFYAFGLDDGESLPDQSREAGVCQTDEKYQAAEEYRAGDADEASEDYRSDEGRRADGGRQGIRREEKADTEPPTKKGKGMAGRLITAGILAAMGLLIGIYQYRITRFLLYSLEFGRFIRGSRLQSYVIALGIGLLAAGVILAAVCVAGFLRKRRHSSS